MAHWRANRETLRDRRLCGFGRLSRQACNIKKRELRMTRYHHHHLALNTL